MIITFNLRDFPKRILDGYEIEAVHPDAFIVDLIESSPDIVFQAVKHLRKALKNPPKTVAEYLTILEKQQLPRTAKILHENTSYI